MPVFCTKNPSPGINLLDPGESPQENAQFLLFLCAVIQGVDEYQDLLRVSVASAGNDHRLGADEAPPAIVSMFLGDELTELLESIEKDEDYSERDKVEMKVGVHVLARFTKDTTDRNRTSPFAFTGNKFEFRMLGSSASVAGPNIMLNTIVADELCRYADRLEKAKDFTEDLHALIKEVIRDHKRIIFNGNNYSQEWVEEAERRGLSNFRTTVDSLHAFRAEKNIDLFLRHKVFTESEVQSRYEILAENYSKTILIETKTMRDMIRRDILPAVCRYMDALSSTVVHKRQVLKSLPCAMEERLLDKLSGLCDALYEKLELLDLDIDRADGYRGELIALAEFCRDELIVDMDQIRVLADELETITGSEYWPYPSYAQMLYSV